MPDEIDPGDGNDRADLAVADCEVGHTDSVEYDSSAIASATATGSRGTLRVRRRYRALPRHNDVVTGQEAEIAPADGLVDRADEIHVHSKFYERAGGDDGYVGDRHETWRPDGATPLADESAFLDACEAHHLDRLSADYEAAMDDCRGGTDSPQ